MCNPFSYLTIEQKNPLDEYYSSIHEKFHHPDRPDIDTYAKRAGILETLTFGAKNLIAKIPLYKREGLGETDIHIVKGDEKYVSIVIPKIDRFYNFIRDEHSKIDICAKVVNYLKTLREYGELILDDTEHSRTGVINLSFEEIDILYINGSEGAKRFWSEVILLTS